MPSSDRQRRINEANAYRDRVLAEAEGKATATIHAAEADRAGRLALAASAADTFITLSDARRYAPSLTDFRLFWEKLAEALAGKSKLILDEEPGRRRHLIMPGLPLERASAGIAGPTVPRPSRSPRSIRQARDRIAPTTENHAHETHSHAG